MFRNHYVIIVWVKRESQICGYYFDSLDTYSKQVYDSISKSIQTLQNKFTLLNLSQHAQEDNYLCGIYCILFATIIAQCVKNNEWSSLKQNIDKMNDRQFVLKFIQTKLLPFFAEALRLYEQSIDDILSDDYVILTEPNKECVHSKMKD